MLRPSANINNGRHPIPPNPINQNNIKRPSQNQIYALGRNIKNRMFYQRGNDGRIIKYGSEDIIRLLNYVSNQNEIPQSVRIPWGDTVRSSKSQKAAMRAMRVRGTRLQQQNKQAVFSSAIALDENNNIMNKRLLYNMVPHRSKHGKLSFIERCRDIRVQYDGDNSNILCLDTTFTRNS